MLKVLGVNINFTPLTKNTNIKDIKESTDINSIHHHLYILHKFKAPVPLKIDITDRHEIITAENFNFCTLKNDTCISDSLRENVIFEKFIVSFVSKIINPEKNMIDVGSNIGIWSIVYSTFIKGNIHAFEPQEEVFNCLVNNIKLNQCKNIIPYNLALSDKKTAYLMNASYDTLNNFGAFRITSSGSLSINADLGDSFKLSNIGFIKMDVEGHEMEALIGLSKTIQESKPVLLVEIHSTQENSNDTFKYIIGLGYKNVIKLTHCDYLFIYDLVN